MRELYEKALDRYGLRAQEEILLEEMSELQKAILKNRRSAKGYQGEYVEKIAEELADVEITLGQIKQGHGLGMDVERWKKYKLEKLREKLEAEE